MISQWFYGVYWKEEGTTNSYTTLDLETTGFEARLDKITEIAALRVEGGRVEEKFVTLASSGRQLEERITALMGITDDIVKDAPVIEGTVEGVIRFYGNLSLLGYNILSDYALLRRATVSSRLNFEREGIDILGICRLFMSEDVRRNLACAYSFYEASQSAAHRAQAGVGAVHGLYQVMMARHGEEHPEVFTAKLLIYKAKREQPATEGRKEYLHDLLKCHRIDVAVQIDIMSHSEMSWMIDNIISRHGRIASRIPRGQKG